MFKKAKKIIARIKRYFNALIDAEIESMDKFYGQYA